MGLIKQSPNITFYLALPYCIIHYTLMRDYNFYVYIMFNERAKATYIGVTGDIERRVIQHKSGQIPGYTQQHKTYKLGYYEHYS